MYIHANIHPPTDTPPSPPPGPGGGGEEEKEGNTTTLPRARWGKESGGKPACFSPLGNFPKRGCDVGVSRGGGFPNRPHERKEGVACGRGSLDFWILDSGLCTLNLDGVGLVTSGPKPGTENWRCGSGFICPCRHGSGWRVWNMYVVGISPPGLVSPMVNVGSRMSRACGTDIVP